MRKDPRLLSLEQTQLTGARKTAERWLSLLLISAVMFIFYLDLICIIYLHLLSCNLSLISLGNTLFFGSRPQTQSEPVNANSIRDFHLKWKRSRSSAVCSGEMRQHSGTRRENPEEISFFSHLF